MAAVLLPLAISTLVGAASSGIQYLMMSRRKRPPVERGRNEDLRISSSDYGSVYPRIWGRVRVAPQIIFASGIQEVARQTQERVSGGKGGGRTQTVVDYSYYTTLWLAACANQVNSIDRVWANSDTIYNLQPDPNLYYYEAESGTRSGGASITADAGCSSGNKVTGLGSGGKLTFSGLPNPVAPTDTTTNIYTVLTVYYKSATAKTLYVAVDGGTPVAYSLPATGSDVNTYTINLDGVHPDSIEFSNASASTVDLDRISIWYSYLNVVPYDIPVSGVYDDFMGYPSDEFYPYSKYNYYPTANGSTGISTFQTVNTSGVRIYTGTQTQTVDSAIITALDARYGSGNGANYASAYRGIAGVVLDNYQVPGPQLPNFTMEVNQGTTDLETIIGDLYEIKEIDSSYLDTSALSGLTLSGLVTYSLQSPQSIVEQLEQWFNFKMVEMDGKIKAVLRNQAPIATITSNDLRAHGEKERVPDFDAIIEPVDEKSLPKEINVSYLDKSDGVDYKNNIETARLTGSTLAQDVLNPAFPFVAVPSEAKAVAEQLLAQAHTRDNLINEISLMPKFAKYTPCDVLTLELENADVDFEILKKTYVPGGKVLVEGITSDEITVTTSVNSLSNNPDILFDNAKFPANTELVVFESFPVDYTHTGLGIYAAVCQKGTGKWKGCALYNRINTADDWIFTRKIESRSPIGVAQGTLGNHTTSAEDTTNTLTIFYYEDVALETVTGTDLDANPQRNLIRIGDEWVQYRTATAATLTDSRYRSAWTISNLRRGLFNTSGERSGHTSSETCVDFTSAMQFIPLDAVYEDKTTYWTATTYGQSQDFSAVKTLYVDGTAPCVIEKVGVATLDAVKVGIKNTPVDATHRKVEVSSSSSMTSPTTTITQLTDTVLTFPNIETITRTYSSSPETKYVRISHSLNGRDYITASNILTIVFENELDYGEPILSSDPPTVELVGTNWLFGIQEPIQNNFNANYVEVRLYTPGNGVTASGSYSSSATSITLVDASSLPTEGRMKVAPTFETFSWTGKSGNTLTGVTRGIEKTTAASIANGDFMMPIMVQKQLGKVLSWQYPQEVDDYYFNYRWKNDYRANGSDGWSAWSQELTSAAAGSSNPTPPSAPTPPPAADPAPPSGYEDPTDPLNNKYFRERDIDIYY